ncbi:MAG: hypothetical protein GF408_06955 [Candidatus Omnitrophica bacterium]|nr:hypothetical protein [Candidatus Omnitrophota bacterium]
MVLLLLAGVAVILMGNAYYRFSLDMGNALLNMAEDGKKHGREGGDERKGQSSIGAGFAADCRFTYMDPEEETEEESTRDLRFELQTKEAGIFIDRKSF